MPDKNALFQSIFKTSFDQPEALTLLQKTVKDYPYFTPAQYYLLLKDRQNKEQAAITSLLFNNPLWLQWQLNAGNSTESDIIKIADGLTIREEAPSNTERTIAAPVLVEPSPIKTQELKTTEPIVNSDKEELLFEPLFATDYFASQGIKLSEELKADDKLGKQLKSFTDWLKTMKKVQPAKLEAESAGPVDQVVQTMAEKSNAEGEVLTETMAEVFVQQGKYAKAREVYEKLSLLNPLKSPYFAAKIEQLKSN